MEQRNAMSKRYFKNFKIGKRWEVDLDYIPKDSGLRKFLYVRTYFDGDFYVMWLWCFAITLTNNKSVYQEEEAKPLFEVPAHSVKIIDNLLSDCRLAERNEVISNALSLFEWAVNQTRDGKTISSLDQSTGIFQEVSLPALDNIRPGSKSEYVSNQPEKSEFKH